MLAGDGARAARRERHAQGAKEGRLRRVGQQYWKQAAFLGAVALLVAAVAFTQTTGVGVKDCPGHWHATFQVYADGQAVNMASTNAQNTEAPGFHMHGNDNLLHTHPAAPRCIPLGDELESLQIDVSSSELVVGFLPGADRSSTQGEYRPDADNELAIFHQPFEGEWRRASFDLLKEQLGNGDKVLITYGNLDDATIASQQASVPDLPPQYQPV